ncbi:MAG: exodeoxyribonuclease VII large subunit [Candidatus Tectomicrobia bacterium]|nr:exodeoxyribonuclease VII large subunit [Candidatus Tectomicrobia bacterium]
MHPGRRIVATQLEFNLATHVHIFTVTELTKAIKERLEGEFADLWIEGEISNLRHPSSGHYYFTLKDAAGQIRAVLFKAQRRLIQFEPEDGLAVILRGRLSVYEARGEYQIIADYLEPKGVGALQLAFEQLKNRLAAEGLFDAAHKQPLPLVPRRIGVVTSPTGAAIRDILRVLERRFATLEVQIFPAVVQGEEAPRSLMAGLETFNRRGEVEVIILTRGGGSMEDLWAFNDERLVRAIFASRIPVISAVGHEIDFTLADFVADVRAPTPSAAAEMVVREKEELRRHIATYRKRLRAALQRRAGELRAHLQGLVRRRVFTDPTARLREARVYLDDLAGEAQGAVRRRLDGRRQRLQHAQRTLASLSPLAQVGRFRRLLARRQWELAAAGRHRVAQAHARFQGLAGRLQALSPLAVLGRGYSICTRPPLGAVVRDAAEVRVGEAVDVLLQRGALGCRVEEVRPRPPVS